MDHFSPWQQLYFNYLGRVYALTFWAKMRNFLGMRVRSWVILLSAALGLYLATRPGTFLLVILGILIPAFFIFSFWRAQKAGYNKFVPDAQDALPETEALRPLLPNERVKLRATGVFSLVNREDFVLFRRPSEYWHVPLGEHIVMVEQLPGHFLYQFFNATTLQKVQNGWLIFGAKPQRALAVTFLVSFGPEYNDPTLFYFVGKGDGAAAPKPRTIYFSFDSEEAHHAVWHTIIADARSARLQAG
ncbi:MAG: hypothetical protein KC443_21950 [Anaerolineales bacterium]|nr:hypothetical protein [Anaerolineales bacterium]